MLLLVLSVLFFVQANAQNNKKEPSIRFGNMEPGKASREQIMNAPAIVDVNEVFKVTHFSISFYPKGGEVFGPYDTKGNTLTTAELELVKKYSHQPVKIVIEDIRGIEIGSGVNRFLSPIVLNYDH
ncbi:MAG: hypothetical protein JWQ38_2274 [Flavipsychrobacter sp.]|nr:hypothetical protein [Flavipsychrobacter sp.]